MKIASVSSHSAWMKIGRAGYHRVQARRECVDPTAMDWAGRIFGSEKADSELALLAVMVISAVLVVIAWGARDVEQLT